MIPLMVKVWWILLDWVTNNKINKLITVKLNHHRQTWSIFHNVKMKNANWHKFGKIKSTTIMEGQAKNLINNLYHFILVQSALWILQSIVIKDASNKIGFKSINLSAQVNYLDQETLFFCRMLRELKLQRHLSKNQMIKVYWLQNNKN